MMTYAPMNIREFASKRETSIEIALAIFETADGGDEDRMWGEPTTEEQAAVLRRAWELVGDADEDVLNWGNERCERPTVHAGEAQ